MWVRIWTDGLDAQWNGLLERMGSKKLGMQKTYTRMYGEERTGKQSAATRGGGIGRCECHPWPLSVDAWAQETGERDNLDRNPKGSQLKFNQLHINRTLLCLEIRIFNFNHNGPIIILWPRLLIRSRKKEVLNKSLQNEFYIVIILLLFRIPR